MMLAGKQMFSKILRMQFLGPIQLSRLVMYLPQFVRLFYRLWTDDRVPRLAKMVPWMGALLMLTPPALELDMIPIVGDDKPVEFADDWNHVEFEGRRRQHQQRTHP